ncbi:MAG: AAA family ATPase, partial [Zetaproteobacteria bacterium]
MTITRIRLENFTAFKQLDLAPSSGINILIGANGTGKTHLMKVAYAACDVSKTGKNFAQKLVDVFLPSGRMLGRLARRTQGSSGGVAEIHRGKLKLRISFSNRTSKPESAKIAGAREWNGKPVESVYVPVKEMLANAPGFRSLYGQRDVHFEEVYADILDRAYRPALRGRMDGRRKKLLERMQRLIKGKVATKEEEFFLRSKRGNLEFPLLAEGMRKIGLLWLLVQNGTLSKSSVLFWDEPEANLSLKMMGPIVDILLELQRMGVQIFLATHNYVLLKEFDLRRKAEDDVLLHAFYEDKATG